MPKVNVLDLEGHLSVGSNDLLKLVLFLVVDGVRDLLTVLDILYEYLDLDLGILAHDLGGDLDAGRAVVIKIKVAVVYADKIYVSVKTAVEGEVCHLRINGLIGRVVHKNSKLGRVGELVGKLYSPGGVAAVVVCELLAADVNVSRGVRAADLKIVVICFGELGLYERLYVEARAAEVVVSAVKAVFCVPGVRKIYLNALTRADIGGVLDKEPAVVDVKNVSHDFSPSFRIWGIFISISENSKKVYQIL